MAGTACGDLRQRGLRSTVAAVVALVLLVAVPAVDAAPVIDFGTVSVTPDSNLVDGATVTVTVTDATPGVELELALCDAAKADGLGCSQWLGHGSTTAGGYIAWEVVLDAVTVQYDESVTDCRAATCELALITWDEETDTTQSRRVPISFDPDAPLIPPPTVALDPVVDLIDRQPVRVSGVGFRADDWVAVMQCHATGPCLFLGEVLAAPDGTIDTHVAVRTVLSRFGEAGTDCRGAAPACRVDVSSGRRRVSVDLHFDPDAPLAPPPQVTVAPSSISDGQEVTISGTGFSPGAVLRLRFCVTGSTECDQTWGAEVKVGLDGSFSVISALYSDLVPTGGFADCRAAPGCEIRVDDWMEGASVRSPVSFGDPGARRRYIDPVFSEVGETRDLLYRSTVDWLGDPIDLRLDIYEPVGDTAQTRPTIVFMFGGWFEFGDKDQLADLARDAARRGFVGVTIDYRIRPSMPPVQRTAAAEDAYDDAVAAVAWLKANAQTYRIDPSTIVATGYSAGGVLAYSLAYLPPERGPASSPVAAAIGMAGTTVAGPSAGDPPVLGLHAADDEILAIGPARDACAQAAAVGAVCEWVEYPTGGHLVILEQTRDFVAKIYDFLRRNVLEPRGYIDPSAPPPPPTPLPPVRPELPVRPAAPTTTAAPTSTTSMAPSPSVPVTSTPPMPPLTSAPPVSVLPAPPPGPATTTSWPPGSGSGAVAADAAAAEPVRSRPQYTG